jgi:hypothetical protein
VNHETSLWLASGFKLLGVVVTLMLVTCIGVLAIWDVMITKIKEKLSNPRTHDYNKVARASCIKDGLEAEPNKAAERRAYLLPTTRS